jgi:SAM-dependent methyltransferase
MKSTQEISYAKRLDACQRVWWKRLLNVQLPYCLFLRGLKLGFTLEVGCGIGRNLAHLKGRAIGVDHNERSVDLARQRGYRAYVPSVFSVDCAELQGRFDSLLLSHILEHMTPAESVALIRSYLDWVKPSGNIVVITPCWRGYRADQTHVTFLRHEGIEAILTECGLLVERSTCFHFVEWVGTFFKYNEYVMIARNKESAS